MKQQKHNKKSEAINPEWILSAYEKELLIKQVTEFISDFVPDAYKEKKYENELDKEIACDLDKALTTMAILNSIYGLNIKTEEIKQENGIS